MAIPVQIIFFGALGATAVLAGMSGASSSRAPGRSRAKAGGGETSDAGAQGEQKEEEPEAGGAGEPGPFGAVLGIGIKGSNGGGEGCLAEGAPGLRFKRDEQDPAVRSELDRWDAGTEPFAVWINRGPRRITAMPDGPDEGPFFESSAVGDLGTIDLPFAPPAGVQTGGQGWVIARGRKNFTAGQAVNYVRDRKGALDWLKGGPLDELKAVARIAGGGDKSTWWLVAEWDPPTCSYKVRRYQADLIRSALSGLI